MNSNNVWSEISKSFTGHQLDQRRFKYFRWKHRIDTDRYKYSEMSKEDFISTFNITEVEMINLEKWESSSLYKKLTLSLYEDKFTSDLIEIYDTVKENALNGDHQSIKTLLSLQTEIAQQSKYINSIHQNIFTEDDEEDEEDDLYKGLDLKI